MKQQIFKVWMQSRYLVFIIFALLLNANTTFAVDFSTPTQTTETATSPTSSVSSETATSSVALPPITGASSLLNQSATPLPPVVNAPSANSSENYTSPQHPFDYSTNLKSDVFGMQLFTGNFAQQGVTQFNPDYQITIGDKVQVRLWGGYTFDSILTVDPQGNIFLPQVGPIKVLGVSNQNLQNLVASGVRRVFRANVFSYASLTNAHPVRVFVGGFVNRPGLYHGTSMDSLLHYLDQAGGIDSERGSFLKVQIKRGKQVRTTLNLYDFLLQGRIPLIQLADGDVIFVAPRQSTVKVSGLAESTKQFEFQGKALTVANLAQLAKPLNHATHVRIVRNTGEVKNVEYYDLAEANYIEVNNGDEAEFTADKKPGTITVRVEGEHLSSQEYVLPYGAHVGDLLKQVKFSERSDKESIQLFRQSVKERQKSRLQVLLKNLESSVLTARVATDEEAALRKEEADRVLKWVERAKKIEPKGQVLISQADIPDNLLLENGDIIKVPIRDGLIIVGGEVLFPNTVAYDSNLDVDNYIDLAGGYTQNADSSRIIILHRDGGFDDASVNADLRAGDSIMVMPKVDVKSFQIGKEILEVLFQIAITASIFLLL